MKSLALELGVSRSTVSFVLGGEADKRRIHPDTAQRILRRATELGFRPDYFARALNTRRTGSIGLVFPDVHEAYMSQMVRGIDEVLEHHGALMVLTSSRLDRGVERRNVESLLHRGIDGLLVVPCADFQGVASPVPSLVETLGRSGLPVVAIDRVPAGWVADSVVQDDRVAARNIVKRLLTAGARRVAYVSFHLDTSSLHHRRQGYLEALAGAGLKPDPRLCVLLTEVNPASHDLELALAGLLALPSGQRPDAWFVTTAGLAYRTRDVLTQLQGFAPPWMARFGADPAYHSSGMLSVVQPHQTLGQRAAELLFQRLRNPDSPAVQALVTTQASSD
jgi:LacI family transcriptional regulator